MQEFNYRFSGGLVKGLRNTDKNRRGQQALTESAGAIPFDGALNSLPTLSEIDISAISPVPSWPYPQIFVLRRMQIVCTATQIYERNPAGVLTLKLDSLVEGATWTVADFHTFVVLANGKQLVFRLGTSGAWTTNNEWNIPNAIGVCNYRGQLILTAPGEIIPTVDINPPHLNFSQAENSQYLQIGIF